eukprot:Seg517.2 transcript_id=Seg517.2/GoldUCD/mRNA.D3Y31 product="HAUS augmin-like complex subunit 4" protein_id=Seg517.2/GoldUCD/D3Y31
MDPVTSRRYPKAKEVINILNTELTVDGVSCSIAEDLNEAKQQLKDTKVLYFQYKMLIDEIKDIILDYQSKKSTEGNAENESKAHLMLQDMLRNAEAKHYLKLSYSEDDSDSCNLLGLTEEQLRHKSSKRKDTQQVLQQNFISDIEQRLKKKCIDLMKIWDSKSEEESDGLALAKSSKLPYFIESEVLKIADAQKKLKYEKQIYQSLLSEYRKVINGYMNSLEELLEKHPLDAKMENTEVTVDWLAAKCDAMQLKIRVLQCQLLKDTYNQDTVAALKSVRELLDAALKESKSELVKIKETLMIYESVGPAFDSLVKQYAQLTAEIDNRKWALSELRRAQGSKN